MISKLLGLFVNTLTVDDKYCPCNSRNLLQFKWNYWRNKKLFLIFLIHLWNLHKFLNIFKKTWPSYVTHFRNYRLRKAWLDKCLKKPRFRTSFDSQHGKGSQTLLKSAWRHLNHRFTSIWGKWSWKILGLFVNTLTTDDQYSLRTSENVLQPIQVQFSKK